MIATQRPIREVDPRSVSAVAAFGMPAARPAKKRQSSQTFANPCDGIHGGEGGIRTHGTRKGTTVFETVPFDHSGTSPHEEAHGARGRPGRVREGGG